MIKLKAPILWDGHMIQTGKVIQLTTELEKSMVSAGNGEYVNLSEEISRDNSELAAIKADLAKRCEALKLDLPDDLTVDQVREAVEKAEAGLEQKQEPEKGASENQTPTDPELNLGRVGGGTQ